MKVTTKLEDAAIGRVVIEEIDIDLESEEERQKVLEEMGLTVVSEAEADELVAKGALDLRHLRRY